MKIEDHFKIQEAYWKMKEFKLVKYKTSIIWKAIKNIHYLICKLMCFILKYQPMEKKNKIKVKFNLILLIEMEKYSLYIHFI